METLNNACETTSNGPEKTSSMKKENSTYKTREPLLNHKPIKIGPMESSPVQMSTDRTHSIHYSDDDASNQESPSFIPTTM